MTLSILTSLLLIFLLFISKKQICKILEVYDYPNERKVHKNPVPLVGGTLIYIYLIIFSIFIWLSSSNNLLSELFIFSINNFIFLNIVIFFVYFIGLIDDKFKKTNFKKLILLSIFVLLICYQDKSLIPDRINFSFGLNFSINNLDEIFIFLIIIVFIISMNLFDGINLQAGIFYLINFLFLSIYLNSANIVLIFIIPLIFFIILNYRNFCFWETLVQIYYLFC